MEFALAVKLAVLAAHNGTLHDVPGFLNAWGVHLTPAQRAALEQLLTLLAAPHGTAVHLQPLILGPDGWIPAP